MSQSNTTKRRARSASRLYAVQALFQMEATGTSLTDIKGEFETHRFGAELDGDTFEEGDVDHFREVMEQAINHQARIDQLTDAALVAKWPIDRIDPTIRAVFRAAGSELINASAPPKVVITEYVDVTKAFFPDGKEARFTNAVLDHMAREINPDAFAD